MVGVVEDVLFGDFEVVGFYEFFLDDVLDFFDVDEGLF